MRAWWWSLVLVVVATNVGCEGIGVRPLRDPGPVEFQRKSDAYWDPYPKNDLHNQFMDDVRPRDFERPVSEVKQAQATPFRRSGSQQAFPE